MTVLYSANFDAVSPGALPSGWTSISGNWQARTRGAISGSLALSPTVTSDGQVVINTNAAISDGVYAFKVRYAAGVFPAPVWRADATFQNGYIGLLSGRDIIFFKKVGGSLSNIRTVGSVAPAGLVDGDIINVEVTLAGTTSTIRIWKEGTSRPATGGDLTDSSITTSGFTGAYQQNGGTDAYGMDDVSVADNAVAPSVTVVPRNDAALYYAPYAFRDDGTAMSTNCVGGYVKFRMTGTSLAVNLAPLTGIAGYPVIRAYIDNMPAIDVQVTSGMTRASFATGLPAGTHDVRLVLMRTNTDDGLWSNENGLKLVSVEIDLGASVSAPVLRGKRAIMYGDSITQGVRAGGTDSVPLQDGTQSSTPLLMEALGAEYAQVGFGAQGFTNTGGGGVPPVNSAYALYTAGASRLTGGLLSPAPDYIICAHGTNGTVAQSDVATAIANFRAAAPNARIFMIVPPGGFRRSEITAATNAAIAAGDTKLSLIDAGADFSSGLGGFGSANEKSFDGVHPYGRTNARWAAIILRQIQHEIEPRRFTVIAV